MKVFSGIARFAMLGVAVLLFAAGCHKSSDQTASNANPASDQTSAQDSSADPASANIVPISNATTSPAPAAQSDQQQSAPAPADTSTAQQSAAPADQYADTGSADVEGDYGVQPQATAPQPPPDMPEYQQPPDPGDGYIWTPGYWNYAPTGYYWVPGVWVQAPYEGALWTPGYWGYRQNRYEFFHGYWGPHIGFYGGVNYGFGYTGLGYQGGYWRGGHFNYNRTVNNINVSVVHNVYSYNIVNRNTTRVSFNGGSGGIQVRPRPAELAAWREPHAVPMRAQVQNERAASINRAQFAVVNHGRPASLIVDHALIADHGVRPMAPPPMRIQAHQQPAIHQQPMQQHPMEQQHPKEQGHPMAQQHPKEQGHPMAQQHPMEQHHPAQQQHPESRPKPEAHSQPKPHPADQHHPEQKPEEHRN